jgi:predicted RNA methylase
MTQALTLPGMEAEARSRELSQFFTPVELATRIWEWSGALRASGGLRVLEPSCGSGNLIAGMVAAGVTPRSLLAVELDARQADLCETRFAGREWLRVQRGSFLDDELVPRERVADLAVMNPPFEDNQAVAFCAKALDLCDRVIALLPADIFYTAGRVPFFLQYAVHRRVNISWRPNFGGGSGGQTNFVVLELRKRAGGRALELGQPQTLTEEWW